MTGPLAMLQKPARSKTWAARPARIYFPPVRNEASRGANVKTSTQIMQKIRREITWGAAIWFLWGISQAVGKWLQIEALKPEKDGAWLWFGFGGAVVFAIFLADCTEAILARMSERTPGGEGRPDE
jgi:hypothetical protein